MKIRCKRCHEVFVVGAEKHCPSCGNPFMLTHKQKEEVGQKDSHHHIRMHGRRQPRVTA